MTTSTPTDNAVALTDDELLAVAYGAETPLSRPLRTVDVTNKHELTAAIGRGYRSLAVRGLLGDDESMPALAEVIQVIATPPSVLVMHTDDDLRPQPGAEQLEFRHDGAGGWSMVLSLPSGVHFFSPVTLDALLDIVSTTISQACSLDTVGDRLAILLRGSDGQPSGGWSVAQATWLLEPADDDWAVTPIELGDVSRESWRLRLGERLHVQV